TKMRLGRRIKAPFSAFRQKVQADGTDCVLLLLRTIRLCRDAAISSRGVPSGKKHYRCSRRDNQTRHFDGRFHNPSARPSPLRLAEPLLTPSLSGFCIFALRYLGTHFPRAPPRLSSYRGAQLATCAARLAESLGALPHRCSYAAVR